MILESQPVRMGLGIYKEFVKSKEKRADHGKPYAPDQRAVIDLAAPISLAGLGVIFASRTRRLRSCG